MGDFAEGTFGFELVDEFAKVTEVGEGLPGGLLFWVAEPLDPVLRAACVGANLRLNGLVRLPRMASTLYRSLYSSIKLLLTTPPSAQLSTVQIYKSRTHHHPPATHTSRAIWAVDLLADRSRASQPPKLIIQPSGLVLATSATLPLSANGRAGQPSPGWGLREAGWTAGKSRKEGQSARWLIAYINNYL